MSEVFAGHPIPLFVDAEMYINPTAEQSDSLTVNEIQSVSDVDSTNPGCMLFRQLIQKSFVTIFSTGRKTTTIYTSTQST